MQYGPYIFMIIGGCSCNVVAPACIPKGPPPLLLHVQPSLPRLQLVRPGVEHFEVGDVPDMQSLRTGSLQSSQQVLGPTGHMWAWSWSSALLIRSGLRDHSSSTALMWPCPAYAACLPVWKVMPTLAL